MSHMKLSVWVVEKKNQFVQSVIQVKELEVQFIVHKFPEHVFRIKGAWGCNEKRLIAAKKEGAREAFVFSHLGGVDVGVVQLFKSTVVNWLQGEVYVNRVRGKPPERQRLLLISDCELDLKNVVDAKVEKPISGNLSAWC